MDVGYLLEVVFRCLAAGYRRPGRALALAAALAVVGGVAGLVFHLAHGFDGDVASIVLAVGLGLGAVVLGVMLVGVAVRVLVHLLGALLALAVRRA